MFKRLHHIALTCSNLDQSRHFYRLLGFDTVLRHYQDADCHILHLSNQTLTLELFEWPDTHTRETTKNALKYVGLTHFALQTDSIDTIKNQLDQHAIRYGETKTARVGGFRYFFFHDPDHNAIEVIEPTQENESCAGNND